MRWLSVLAAMLGLSACGFEPLGSPESGPVANLRVVGGSNLVQGGTVALVAALRRAGDEPGRLTWRTGRALLLRRGTAVDQGRLVSDSVFLRWDSLPPADTHGVRRDTVGILIDGAVLATLVLEIRNILPLPDSVIVAAGQDLSARRGVPWIGDTATVAVHPGEAAFLLFPVRDPDRNFRARWNMGLPLSVGGGRLDWRSGDPADSVLLWTAPPVLLDTTVACTLTDGLGGGRRILHLRLATYHERGSVWAGMRTELAKFGRTVGGQVVEVARLRGLTDATSLSLDPRREGGWLLVADRGASRLRSWTSEGLARTAPTVTGVPLAVACDADLGACWTGGRDSVGRGFLHRAGTSVTFESLPGPVGAVTVDQSGWAVAWFASPDSGVVGRTSGGQIDTLVRDRFVRPVDLAFDPSLRWVWVADLARGAVVALDTQAVERRRIVGLSQPVAVGAGGGVVWVAEAGAGRVRRFGSDGSLQATFDGLNGPLDVIPRPDDALEAWIADTEAGRLLLVRGSQVLAGSSGRGINRPNALAVHGGVE